MNQVNKGKFLPFVDNAIRTPSSDTVRIVLRFLSLRKRQSDRIRRIAETISILEFGRGTVPQPTSLTTNVIPIRNSSTVLGGCR
ncbi:hypothetical protein DERP_012651 [Dermatophagoides pteronyssinus]|uniref:Uncharacterized protein n=1 Tax=Dermatophagoides pteronyssinus TaxID=6956 RepID=A0ABQ8IYH3_DERPT|nr:hypothetical protein DERP_012651 [Dermatophagoides pteronyssinus]